MRTSLTDTLGHMASQPALSSFIWSVADLLRGDYKQSDYGKVILPFTVLRRLDCVLEPTKDAVLTELAAKEKLGVNPAPSSSARPACHSSTSHRSI